jgi:hypothetical protein
LGAVAGKVEQFNLINPLGHPGLDEFAVMNSQVVQNQKDLFARIFYQGSQEFNQLVRIKGIINNHPTRFALIGYRRNHGELLARTANGQCNRRFARWRKASAAHIRVDQSSLIAPVNFSTLASGALLYGGVLTVQPSLHGLRAFFVCKPLC